tara:strand:- start:932 stop:1231 length:300 start_codon:yes stop_codon:yes gene_type:complete
MPSRSKSDKYWLANNPNGEVNDAQVVALKNLSTADLTEIEEAVASFDELRALAGAIPMAAIADLDQDISAAYVEAEVQALSDKVDALLAALRTAGLLAS